jgi:catechol 2,3-dioxygenase-like lactoylglutathione lyase family enzyme
MNPQEFAITGIEEIHFGLDDFDAARRFLGLYGLSEVKCLDDVSRWEALDGSAIELHRTNDPALPPGVIPGPTGRRYVWGVADHHNLEAIGAELRRDRPVQVDAHGMISARDDNGHTVSFRVTQRHPYDAGPSPTNVAGCPPARPTNVRVDFRTPGRARKMGHLVFWSRDPLRAAAFYRERLGFRVSDEMTNNGGIFLRAKAHEDHHSLFIMRIGPAPFENSLQHVEFEFADFQEVMVGGEIISRHGYETIMGPGRHVLGSNWYWYFATPMGCAFELSADMDRADDHWQPGTWNSLEEVKGWMLRSGTAQAAAANPAK